MKFNDYFPNVVVVNLDRRTDRLEAFDKQAKELEISYERFPAVAMDDPVEGCRQSHIGVLSKYQKDPLFVFEDDALAVDDFYSKLTIAMQSLPDDWDMAYLGAHILKAEDHNEHWLKSHRASSTHAYFIRGRARQKLLDGLKAHNGHADAAFSNVHKDMNVYVVKSTLFRQAPGYSDIQQNEVDYADFYKF